MLRSHHSYGLIWREFTVILNFLLFILIWGKKWKTLVIVSFYRPATFDNKHAARIKGIATNQLICKKMAAKIYDFVRKTEGYLTMSKIAF